MIDFLYLEHLTAKKLKLQRNQLRTKVSQFYELISFNILRETRPLGVYLFFVKYFRTTIAFIKHFSILQSNSVDIEAPMEHRTMTIDVYPENTHQVCL